MYDSRPTRREVLRGAGIVTGGLLVGGALAPSAVAASVSREVADGTVTLTEGTNICAAASPDGTRVAFDLVTAVWTVPVGGGPATRLTADRTDATQPRWSPDGEQLVFQAYRDGNFHLWAVAADGTGLRQLTSGRDDHREPRFSPDGATLVFSSDRGRAGSYGIHVLDLATGTVTALTDSPAEEAAPVFSADGRSVVFTVDEVSIASVELATGAVRTLVTGPQEAKLFGPAPSPDGTRLAYVRVAGATAELVVDGETVSAGEDVFGFAPTWLSPDELLYTADGTVRRRRLDGSAPVSVPFAAAVPAPSRPRYRQAVRDIDTSGPRAALGIASPVASPDGALVAFRALGALYLLTVGDPVPRRLVANGSFSSDPDFSPDGTSLVYASDRAGTANLWRHDLATGDERRLTAEPGAQVTPRFSPDGTRVAYADQDGVTWVLDLSSGASRAVTPTLFQPGRASWSADGATLALAAVKPFSARFREGTSQILTVNVADGALTYTEPAPYESLATRGDDGPVFSPDGAHLAFVIGSTARVVPVDAAGRFTGPVRQVTDEVTDSVSWLGADTLLYLHHGRLRTVGIRGGRPATVPLALDWSPARVREKAVLHVGALWDGRASELRRDVDIVLDGDRVQAVLPAEPGRATVDAAGLTAMPGLIDAHVHWHLRGRQWGDRQGRVWLSYGITSTRSPGDPAVPARGDTRGGGGRPPGRAAPVRHRRGGGRLAHLLQLHAAHPVV